MVNAVKEKITVKEIFSKGAQGKGQFMDKLMTRARTIENMEKTMTIKGTQKTPRYQIILRQAISGINQINESLKLLKDGSQLSRILKLELQHEKELWETIENLLYELKSKIKKRGRETEALTELAEIKPLLKSIKKRLRVIIAHLQQDPQQFEEMVAEFRRI